MAYEIGISEPIVWRILHEERMPPYHVQKVKFLHADDYPCQADIVQWMLRMINNDTRFPALIIFSDKAKFSREGIVSMRNQHI